MEDFYLIIDRIGEAYKQYKEGQVKEKAIFKVLDYLPFLIFLSFIYLLIRK